MHCPVRYAAAALKYCKFELGVFTHVCCAGFTNFILFLDRSSESVGFVLSSILFTALHRQVFLKSHLTCTHTVCDLMLYNV